MTALSKRTAMVVAACVVASASASAAEASLSYGTGADGFIYEVDYDAGTASQIWQTGIVWFGATDGVTPSTFYATPSGGVVSVTPCHI